MELNCCQPVVALACRAIAAEQQSVALEFAREQSRLRRRCAGSSVQGCSRRGSRLWTLLWLHLLLLPSCPHLLLSKTQPPPPQPPVDFNHPPRDYALTNVQGWSVWVEKELADSHPLLASNALARLDRKLDQMLSVLPRHAHPALRRLRIFLMLGVEARRGGRDNGAEYFQPHAPLHFGFLDARMSSSIVIYSARNFVWLSDFWAGKMLVHEFAHAWHLEQWPEEQADILQAYEAAMQKRLYRQVRSDDGHTLDRGYAATNQLEYFAELSCMYFVGCNYFPFNRRELEAYDPEGTRLLQKMWRLERAGLPAAGRTSVLR